MPELPEVTLLRELRTSEGRAVILVDVPELPEVTVIVNSLNRKIKGLALRSIEFDWPKKFDWGGFSEKDVVGAKVIGVERKGKVVVINLNRNLGLVTSFPPMSARIDLDSESSRPLRAHGNPSTGATQISLLIHLKLTGQLIYQDQKTRIAGGHPIPPLNLPVPNKTTRATFIFDNPSTSLRASGGYLYFNDMRKFGWVKVIETEKLKVENYLKKIGPDPLEMKFEEFNARIQKKPNSRIKKLLMDQTFVSGIGNIYSDEGLWRAMVHPERTVKSLAEAEVKALFDGVRESMQLAIQKGGSSANTFVDTGGEKGLFLTTAKAYHMTGKPCARCKTPIERKKMDSRSAHFCPNCQVLT